MGKSSKRQEGRLSMEPISVILHAANILLSLALLIVYSQNLRKMKTRYTIGLMLFAAIFLVQGVLGLFFDASMAMYSSNQAEKAAFVLEGVKAASLAVMLWISWE